MSTIDSFEFILNDLVKDIKNVNDTLALIGILYLGKVAVKASFYLVKSIKAYLAPNLISNEKWIGSLGNWAILTGCNNRYGRAFAKELAKRKLNLIFIDESNLNELADYLSDQFQIDAICLESALSLKDLSQLKEVGLLVNCSTDSFENKFFHQIENSAMDERILTDINTSVNVTRLVLPPMIKRRNGLIVFATINESPLSWPFNSINLSASQFIDTFARSLQFQYANSGIKIQFIKLKKEKDSLSEDKIEAVEQAFKYFGWLKSRHVNLMDAFESEILKTTPGTIFKSVYSIICKKRFFHSEGS